MTNIYTKDLGVTLPIDRQPLGVAASLSRRVDLIPIGMWSERRRDAIRSCKAVVRSSCFGPLTADLRVLCDHALNILVPTE